MVTGPLLLALLAASALASSGDSSRDSTPSDEDAILSVSACDKDSRVSRGETKTFYNPFGPGNVTLHAHVEWKDCVVIPGGVAAHRAVTLTREVRDASPAFGTVYFQCNVHADGVPDADGTWMGADASSTADLDYPAWEDSLNPRMNCEITIKWPEQNDVVHLDADAPQD